MRLEIMTVIELIYTAWYKILPIYINLQFLTQYHNNKIIEEYDMLASMSYNMQSLASVVY